MKKYLVLFLAVSTFVLNSCSKEEEVSKSETNEVNNSGNSSQNQKAKLKIKLEGRDSFDNIKVSIRVGENSNTIEMFEQTDPQGEITFNVDRFLNKEIVIKVHEIQKKSFPVLKNTTTKTTIKKGDNNLTIKIPKKEINSVKITVNNTNNNHVDNIKVYGMNESTANIVKMSINMLGSSALQSVDYIETNSEGVAFFENLDKTLGSKYHFIIVTQEPNMILGQNTEYKESIVMLDGTLKTATMNID